MRYAKQMRRAVNHWIIKAEAILQGPVESYKKESKLNKLWLKKHKAKSWNWKDLSWYFWWHSVVTAVFLWELGGGDSCWMFLYKEKDNLNIFFLSIASWKLNCDDKDQAIVLKHWTLYEIIAEVLNSNLVAIFVEKGKNLAITWLRKGKKMEH